MKKVALCFAAVLFFTVQVYSQVLSVPEAREAALAITGGGTITSLELTPGDAGSVYHIVIVNNAVRYEVTINAQTGDVLRLTSAPAGTAPVAQPGAQASPSPSPQPGGIFIGNVVPRPPSRPGGPANPPVSAQRAVEIARDHLVSIGVTNVRFDYVYLDWERGRWVWSVEFDGRGWDYEFYIDVNTGAIIDFRIDR